MLHIDNNDLVKLAKYKESMILQDTCINMVKRIMCPQIVSLQVVRYFVLAGRGRAGGFALTAGSIRGINRYIDEYTENTSHERVLQTHEEKSPIHVVRPLPLHLCRALWDRKSSPSRSSYLFTMLPSSSTSTAFWL